MTDLEDYLSSKKIDAIAFRNAQAKLYEDWEKEFEVMHPKSFEARKMFSLNKIRREFPVKIESAGEMGSKIPKLNLKPVIKPKTT